MRDTSRRFTDQEVALVLRRASEVDEASSPEGSSGLSLEDLHEIAREVGISREALDRAVASLDRTARVGSGLAGAPRVRKAAYAVSGELDREGIARLIRLVDEKTDNAGSVSEALGSVRWTGSDRLRSTRVSITPADGRTSIEVVEKAEPRLRRILHLVPAAWGVMLAGPLAASLQPGAPGMLAVAGLGALLGAVAGRGAWTMLSAASGRRVRRLAEGLAEEAERAGAAGGHGGRTGDEDSAP